MQRRAYEKGLAVARVIYISPKLDPGWMWPRYLIEGTQLEPETFCRVLDGDESAEDAADQYGVTVEQVEAAVAWLRENDGRMRRRR